MIGPRPALMAGPPAPAPPRVVPASDYAERSAAYAWPVTAACRVCGDSLELRVLSDDICSRAAAVIAVDEYLTGIGWQIGALSDLRGDTCPECRSAIAAEVNSLTAPGTGDPHRPAGSAAVVDQLGKMTAQNVPDDPAASGGVIPADAEQDPNTDGNGGDEWECETCHTVNKPDRLAPDKNNVCAKCGNKRELPEPE